MRGDGRVRLASKWMPAIYFIVGQAGWFASVVSAAKGFPAIGVAFAGCLLALHLLRVARPLVELKLIVSVTVIGAVWESVVAGSGLLTYPSGVVQPVLAPFWLPPLWAMFAAQFNTTYQWLKPHLLAAAALGAFAGPLSFRAGAALGALRFAKPWPAIAALALGWAVLLPVVVILSRRWDGVQHRLEE